MRVYLHGGVDVSMAEPELPGFHGHVGPVQQRGAVVAQLQGLSARTIGAAPRRRTTS